MFLENRKTCGVRMPCSLVGDRAQANVILNMNDEATRLG